MIKPHPNTDGMTAAEIREAIVDAEDDLKLARELAINGGEDDTVWITQGIRMLEAALARRIGQRPEADQVGAHHFDLIDAKTLLAQQEEETSWLWNGILPIGGISLNVAKPKVGKTTFALNLAVAVSRGDLFLNRTTTQGSVIYLALEEKRSEIQKKLKALGVTDEKLLFHFGSAPVKAIEEIVPLLETTHAHLLVIDVLQKFIRARDLNDYAQVTAALEPIMAAARKFACHVMLTHHAGKADRTGGDEVLGSTALLGGVDTSIQLKKRNKQRTFYTIQRYGDDVEETVIELDNNGAVRIVGSKTEVDVDETIPAIIDALSDGPLARDDVLQKVERKQAVVLSALAKLGDQGKIERAGRGRKGDPYIYNIPYFRSAYTIGTAGTESEPTLKATPDNEKFCSQSFGTNHDDRKSSGMEFPAPADPWNGEGGA